MDVEVMQTASVQPKELGRRIKVGWGGSNEGWSTVVSSGLGAIE